MTDPVAVPTRRCPVCRLFRRGNQFHNPDSPHCIPCSAEEATRKHEEAVRKRREMKQTSSANRSARLAEAKARRNSAKARKKAEEEKVKADVAAEMAARREVRRVGAKLNIAERELAARELAKRHLLPFIVRHKPDYIPGWVHKDICTRLEKFAEDVEEGKSPRLMIQMPPRSGKSEVASVNFPAWYLGRNPKHEIISAAYAGSLAVGFSRKVRALLRDALYKVTFKTRLDTDNQNAEGWMTTAGGGYIPAGVGGPITGKGAHCLIIDDPVKNAEEAESETSRAGIKAWYQTTAYTRLAPGGGVLIIQCMTGDTPVTMADGGYKRLDTIRPGDMVKAWKDGHAVDRKVLNWAEQGEDDVFEIRTGSCRVRANARHPFLVRRRSGAAEWVRVRDLAVGDKLVASSRIESPREATLSEREAWLLGYMFGDGWLTRRDAQNYDRKRDTYYPRRGYVTCVATTHREEENVYVSGLFKALFDVVPKVTKYGYIRTEVQRVGRWFAEKGLTGKAATKRLPQYLYSEPLAIREAFLAGYNTADGAIASTGVQTDRWMHGCCNDDLMRDIRHLARSCGRRPTNIHTRDYIAQAPNSPHPTDAHAAYVQWSGVTADDSEFTAYSAIRSIAPAGRALVYDIEVDDAHCFIADGLVSKNTRWHDDDLSGWLEELGEKGEGDVWDIVRYPALAVEDEKYRRKGEALHPARYPLAAMLRIQKAVGPRTWQALYQQNPTSEDGDYFNRSMFEWYTGEPPKRLTTYAAWDLAIGKGDRNDYTVGVVVGIDDDDNMWVLDVRRGRWDSFAIVEEMLSVYRMWKPETTGIEKGQLSMAIGPYLEQRITEERLYSMHVKDLPPGRRDKESRARAIQGRMKQGKVRFPKEASWLDTLMHELLRFPNGVHDDMVDALAWVGLMLQEMSPPKPEKKADPDAGQKWKKKLAKFTKAGFTRRNGMTS